MRGDLPKGFWARENKSGHVYGFHTYVNGKQIKSKSYASLKAAKAAKRETETKKTRGEYVEPSRMTFKEVADLYIANARRIRPNTRHSYNLCLTHILPALGPHKIQAIKEQTLIDFFVTVDEAGLAPRTQQVMSVLIAQIFKFAIRKGYAAKNPLDNLDKHEKPQRGKKRDRVLTPDELKSLASAFKREEDRRLFVLLATTGLRIGEALALQWPNVDLDKGLIRVEHTIDLKSVLGPPKTEASRRVVPIPPMLVDLLREHRAAHDSSEAAWEVDGHGRYRNGRVATLKKKNGDSDFVFDATYSSFHKQFYLARRAAALDKKTDTGRGRMTVHEITPHTIRHTYGSMLVSEGIDIARVSRVMGHANPSTTLDLYTHEYQALQEKLKIGAAVDQALGQVLVRSAVPQLLPAASR